MKAGWQLKKIGDICQIIGGGTPSKDNKEFYKGEIRWATVRDMKSDILSETEFKITEQAIKNSATNIIPKGNVVIATRVGLGKVSLLENDTAINQDLRGVIPKNKDRISEKYLFLWFKSIAHHIEAAGTGATVHGVKLPFIKSLEVPLPPLSEQRRIVAILDEAFAGIAAAKEKAEQNLKNAKEVFESAISSIEGEKVNLGDYVEIKTGKLDANAAVENGIYPFFTCSREIFSINDFSFDCEAILLAGNNAVGDFNVKYFSGKFNAYQRTYVITANKRKQILCKYLYFQLLNSLKKFKEKSVGAATKFLKLGMIKEMKISLPSLSEQEVIILRLRNIQDEIENLESIYQQKLADLEELKKSVLQQAFSGAL